jgi:hypothetical protein
MAMAMAMIAAAAPSTQRPDPVGDAVRAMGGYGCHIVAFDPGKRAGNHAFS